MRRRARADVVLVEDGEDAPPTEAARLKARKALSRARREGRFGTSDLYEIRMEQLGAATSRGELSAVTGDLGALFTEASRAKVLRVLRRAQSDGRLCMEEFGRRTERCLGPLTIEVAREVVDGLGYRVERPLQHARGSVPRALLPELAAPVGLGALLAGAVLAAPAGLGAGVLPWVPMAAGVGVIGGVLCLVVRVAWRIRAPADWRARAAGPWRRAGARERAPGEP